MNILSQLLRRIKQRKQDDLEQEIRAWKSVNIGDEVMLFDDTVALVEDKEEFMQRLSVTTANKDKLNISITQVIKIRRYR